MCNVANFCGIKSVSLPLSLLLCSAFVSLGRALSHD